MVSKTKVVDQMGREVEVPIAPKRIVSLVPSQTELLYELGLNEEVVGQTLFCIHPEAQHKTKPRVGGTKNFSFEKIAALKPDLIIGNKEENEEERIKAIMDAYPVWMSDIHALEEALDMMEQIGRLVDRETQAEQLVNQIKTSFAQLLKPSQTQRVAYFIWRNPWMAAGHNTFIDDMLKRIGLNNVFTSLQSRYPEVTLEMIVAANPEVVLLSSEPYPFKEKHMQELQQLLPQAKILLVDGELFSWYGSRLKYSVSYFTQIQERVFV